MDRIMPVSYTHLRAHETRHDLVCRLLLEKKSMYDDDDDDDDNDVALSPSSHCVPVSATASRQHHSAFCCQSSAVPSYRLSSSYGRRAFSVAGPTTWNSLYTETVA